MADLQVCLCGKVTVDGFEGGVISVGAGIAADAVFQWILWRDDKIYHIKTGHLDHILYDGQVTDMQWVE
jgi:hypothetical protein